MDAPRMGPEASNDDYGLPAETKQAYGALTEMAQQARALRQYNPAATQYQNINPGSAPGPKKTPAVRGAQPLNYPQAPPAPQPETGRTGRGFGPSSGLVPGSGAGLGDAGQGGDNANNAVRRGFGPHSGLVSPEQETQHQQPIAPTGQAGTSQSYKDALQRMAALPNASTTVQLYARLAAQET